MSLFALPSPIGSVKSSSADYDEANKTNLTPLFHIQSEKSLVELEVSKKELFDYFHIFRSIEKFTFSP